MQVLAVGVAVVMVGAAVVVEAAVDAADAAVVAADESDITDSRYGARPIQFSMAYNRGL